MTEWGAGNAFPGARGGKAKSEGRGSEEEGRERTTERTDERERRKRKDDDGEREEKRYKRRRQQTKTQKQTKRTHAKSLACCLMFEHVFLLLSSFSPPPRLGGQGHRGAPLSPARGAFVLGFVFVVAKPPDNPDSSVCAARLLVVWVKCWLFLRGRSSWCVCLLK